jgi:mutual gliding-motility protein MglA
MAVLNHDTKEVAFKLVYCGAPMSGKTTNLDYIYSRTDQSQRGELTSLETSSDRTLFFDFLPMHAMVINGYQTKFMLYTVPGQVHYNATRQMVLKGVDGIVFVVDSQPERMEENVVAWQSTERCLKENGVPIDHLPIVLQYNKRDVPNAVPKAYLDYILNRGPVTRQAFECCAATGVGVFSALNALAQDVLMRFHTAMGHAPRAPQPSTAA